MLYEKDINLDIGLRLNAWLLAQGGRTLLTRTQDLAGGDRPSTTTGADLKARTDAANEARVDLFVSIHNNALSTTTSGTETFHYYYSSAAARTLATDVQRELVAALGLPDRGVKTAGFYVLRNSEMPAILVEGGFLTNPAEALLLADPNVRQRIAEAVGRGIAALRRPGRRRAPAPGADDRPLEDEARQRAGRLQAGEDRGRQPRRPRRVDRGDRGLRARRRRPCRPRSARGRSSPGRSRAATAS